MADFRREGGIVCSPCGNMANLDPLNPRETICAGLELSGAQLGCDLMPGEDGGREFCGNSRGFEVSWHSK